MSKKEQTHYLINLLSPKSGEIILDLGCGTGDEIKRICQVSRVKKVYGVDNSEEFLTKAKQKLSKEGKKGLVELIKSDAAKKLPFPPKHFNAVFSAELTECLTEKERKFLLKEIHRVLKPGGRVLTEHTDWDTQVWNTSNKSLERKLVHAFCDTTQGWMQTSEGWMGRKLWGLFNQSKLFKKCKITSYNLIDTKYTPSFYGYQRSLDIKVVLKNKKAKITNKNINDFLTDLRKQSKKGTYFYSVNRYIHIGYK